MPYQEEDIFGGGGITEIIIRWHDIAVNEFDSKNQKTFEWLKELVQKTEFKSYFLKVKEDEQKILIPLMEEDFDIELYVEWMPLTFSYKIRVNKNKKTRLNSEKISLNEITQWLANNYAIEQLCKFIFIDINESKLPKEAQANLFERVRNLEILPKTKIENDREIWNKYINAQRLLLERNSRLFPVKKYYPLLEIKNTSGEISRYKFKVDLHVDENDEYKEIEEELRELKITDQFDNEGNIFLDFDDIYRGLDAVIHKKFSTIIEREKGIAAILKLKPLGISDRVEYFFKNAGYSVFCFQTGKRQITITPGNTDPNLVTSHLKELDFELKQYKGEFKIINHGLDITKNEEFNNQHKIHFGDYIKGQILPIPVDNTFTIVRAEESDICTFARFLQKMYGVKNVLIRKSFIYQGNLQNHIHTETSDFTDEFWNDIKRDLYNLDFKVEVNESTETLSYEFETKIECLEKYEKLKEINKFQFIVPPDRPEFKFKVKTNLIKNKTNKQLFYEIINDLAGAEFHFELPGTENNKQKEYISIGKLIASESDLTSLTFSLPHRYKDEKKVVKALLNYLEEKKPISNVQANLKGDKAKISWLLQAMAKVIQPEEKPNGKAVNPKLKEFIFDSSKAEPVYRDISEDSQDWHDLKKNELLKLNNSQRQAILASVNSRDLCLIQGPPGTGKTTVIAELMWQLIRKEQDSKILLTSETNLAVDNALEKLLNKEHTIVKPLRFGKQTKFEEEGKKYSFDRIMKWIDENYIAPEFEEDRLEESEEDDEEPAAENSYNNAVQLWMNQIAEKSHRNFDLKYADALKKWAFELTQPAKDIKLLFKEKYFKYANVVGSTCSSCGSPSFMKSYQFIYNTKSEFIAEPDKRWNWIPVEFDTVIMDEASKATPPEMLLPLCFGAKSIVIGDHKQLPPMLNEKEFKEALIELKDPRANQLVEEIDKEFVETSQFERLIMNHKTDDSIIARLNIQYRMHPKINDVIRQFYTGENDKGLEPAEELVENADKHYTESEFSRYHGLTNPGFIRPEIHTIWIDVNEPEEQSGTSRINEKEVETVKRVLIYLKNSHGFEDYFMHWQNKFKNNADKLMQEQEIGIISFYGQQVRKLQTIRRFAQRNLGLPIRLKTVDKFQGMERNIVIVSTVRSNKIIINGLLEKNSDIGFAKAPERLNVALSRARRLLIVVGNLKFFEQYKDKNGNSIYKNAIEIIRSTGMIIDYRQLDRYNEQNT